MGEQDLAHVQIAGADRLFDALEVSARIDDGGLTGAVAPQQRAILLEGRHGNDENVEHGEHPRQGMPIL